MTGRRLRLRAPFPVTRRPGAAFYVSYHLGGTIEFLINEIPLVPATHGRDDTGTTKQ